MSLVMKRKGHKMWNKSKIIISVAIQIRAAMIYFGAYLNVLGYNESIQTMIQNLKEKSNIAHKNIILFIKPPWRQQCIRTSYDIASQFIIWICYH